MKPQFSLRADGSVDMNLSATFGNQPKGLVARRGAEAALQIYAPIGAAYGGVSASDVADALAEMKDAPKLTLYISSPGGDFFEGIAIYSQLVRHAKTHDLTVVVDGIAASAASVVAMAATRIVMAPSARMMIHSARAGIHGTAAEMRAQAELIEKASEDMVAIYAKRTGLSADAIREYFASGDTYLSAQEAVDLHFADAIEGQEPKAQPKPKAKPTASLDVERQLKVARINSLLQKEKRKTASGPKQK